MTKFVKFQCVFLSFALLICSFFICCHCSVFAETVKVGYISGTDVNIRKDASTSSKEVANVSQVYVIITNEKIDTQKTENPTTKKTYIWYEVTYKTSSETINGYVREDLIQVEEVALDDDFAKKLEDFPKSYHNDLILLHAIYPEWSFTADKVPLSFDESVAAQDYLFYKLVQSTTNSWLSMRKGCFNWSSEKFVETDSGGWYGASREVIAYYMDPRNFLNPNDIYQYLQQTYDKKSQTIDGVEQIIEDTFLDGKITDKKDDNLNKNYSEVILMAAEKSNVNPYVLASTLIQEQGRDGSTLSKGSTYKDVTVYNFFNYGASGKNQADVINNGLKYAYEQGWTTPSKSIIDGAVRYGSGYINAGQDTYFYKNYNVLNPDELWHQYAQNVADSLNSSKILKTAYSKNKDIKLNFRIPVYNSMPDDVSPLPEKSNKLNNYYFDDIEVDGLTPVFERFTYEYSLSVEGNTTIKISLPDGASLYGKDSFSLSKGDNEVKLAVTSQTGYTNVYIINVDSQKKCKLSLEVVNKISQEKEENNSSESNSSQNNSIESISSDNSSSSNSSVDKEQEKIIVLGDTNGDGSVTLTDLANVRLHLLEIITLKGDALKGADTNNDDNISITDLANIRLHLLEIITLK